jgi:AcrR family transcriptional regulator
MANVGKGRVRVSREVRREVLLAAGAEIASEIVQSGQMNPLHSLAATEVTTRAAELMKDQQKHAGMSKSALYYLWGDGMEGFRRDLVTRLCTQSVDPDALAQVAEEHFHAGLDAVVRACGNWEYDRLSPGGDDHGKVLMYAGLLALALDESTLPLVQKRAAEDLDTYAEIYSVMLTAFGLAMRPGYTWRQLASALSAMVQGFAQEAAVDPVLSTRVVVGDADWTLFAIAARAVVEGLTQPVTAEPAKASLSPELPGT